MKKLGKRYNKGKLRWRNFPLFLLRPMIRVGEFGEKKYDTFNFLKGLPVNGIMDSMKRHLDKFEDPDKTDYDDESKCHHLAHVAWNALVAVYVLTNRPELDDRYKGEETNEKQSDYLTVVDCISNHFLTSISSVSNSLKVYVISWNIPLLN